MKSNFLLTTISLIFVGSLFLNNSQAQNFPMWGILTGRDCDKLNLTDSQKEEIDKIRDAHQKDMIGYRSELQKLRIDLKNQWDAAKPDKKQIESIVDKMAAVRSKMNKERISHWFDVYNLLDDNQKQLFKEMRGKFREGVKMRMHQFRDRFDERPMRMGRRPFGRFF